MNSIPKMALTVLSLEDSLIDFEIINAKLSGAGYILNISRVDTELDFTDAVRNNQYDIILADYNLYGFDGFQALLIANQYCPDTPFISVSGSIGEIMAVELLKNGAIDYVLKDRLERLPYAVKRALEEAESKISSRKIEESLRQSEEKYRTIFENVQDVFYQTELDGIIREISPSIKYFSEFSADDLLGKTVNELYFDPEERRILIERIQTKGEIRDYKVRLKTKNGIIKYASINARLIFGANGEPDHIDGAIRDITERVKAEETLLASEEKFRNVFENHVAVKLILDPETGQIMEVNKAASKFYGWSIGELKQMNIADLSTISFEAVLANIQKITNDEKINFEFQHICKDGTIRDVEVLTSRVMIAEKEFLHAIIHDISEKKKAEQRLNLLSLSIEQSPVMVLITNPEAKIEYVNQSFCATTGYTTQEIIGKNPRILSSGKQNEAFYRNLWSTIISGEHWSGEFQDRKKNGEFYWVDASISPLVNQEGRITHFVMIKEDITDKRKMMEDLIFAKEKAEASDRLKTAFMNNISHEIRTPLNAIQGFAPMIIDPSNTQEEKEEFVNILNLSSDRLIQTVTDYMDTSLIVSGNLEVVKKDFSPIHLFEEIRNRYQSRCDEKHLILSVSLPQTENQVMIKSDEKLIQKIVFHLVDNAIKFTKEGSITIGLSILESSVEFSIRDTGIGIKEEALTSVFNFFMQEDNSNTRAYEGSGLGLSIVRGIVKLMGGTIRTESIKGVGSLFVINLPCEIMVRDRKETEQKPPVRNQVSRPVILIAEDEDSNYLLMELILKSSFNVIRAETGLEAVEMCRQTPGIRLVLMDIKMPKMNGFTATGEIKKFSPDLPVIALTAYAEIGMHEKCLEAGCDGYLTKPVNKELLFSTIASYGFVPNN